MLLVRCNCDMRLSLQQFTNQKPRVAGAIWLFAGLLLLVTAFALAKTAPNWRTIATEELSGARPIGRGVAILFIVPFSAVIVVTGLFGILLGGNANKLLRPVESFRGIPIFWRVCLLGVCVLSLGAGFFWLMGLMLRILGRWT